MMFFVTTLLTYAVGVRSLPLTTTHRSNTVSVLRLHGDQAIPTCSEICDYSHSKAHCHDRNLFQIPHSTGCEGAILLELQGNKIISITSEQMSGYQQVSTLDISGNYLSNIIPGTFDRNSNLKNIDVSNNDLTILNSKMFKGTEHSLFQIEIQFNSINLVTQDAFEGLECVTNIYLSHNKLQNLLPGTFKDLISLQYLDLSQNKLAKLPQNLFHNSTSLRKLYLHKNKLQQIPNRLFDGLESLTDVRLSDNELISVPAPQELGLFHQLWRMDLQNNKIHQSGVILPFLANVTENLQVTGNPLLCDCNFQILQVSLHFLGGSHAQPIQCMYHNESNFTTSYTLPFDCYVTTQTHPTPSNNSTDKLLSASTHDGSHFDDIMSASPPEYPKCKGDVTPHYRIYVIVICALIILIAGLIIFICLICFVPSIRSKFILFVSRGTKELREQRQSGSDSSAERKL
ncbi:Insulin-like growth factor-binding protein complex acid labile subunit [Holothuria leucospilota]|uniref:Insulin-like growth factor-binding protein complex acid labile subunit n=1 Tax=Holothuria leucospilota TaxID=206669 RepID=A0A9Q0YUJ5_HOLLE|nr:Insulin-like growth factor-binding protein complex acid labile subunit [Holothuria leucospilota]